MIPQKNNRLRVSVLVCTQSALCGAVVQKLRAVYVDWTEFEIQLYCFFDGEISEDDSEEMGCVETEISCDNYLAGMNVIAECKRIDYPNPVPIVGKECVYSVDPIICEKNYSPQFVCSDFSEAILRRVSILLSCQHALLGAIPFNLRAVVIDWSEKDITLFCVFNHGKYTSCSDPCNFSKSDLLVQPERCRPVTSIELKDADAESVATLVRMGITLEEQATMQKAARSVQLDFPQDRVHLSFIRLDYPELLPHIGEELIFSRKENLVLDPS